MKGATVPRLMMASALLALAGGACGGGNGVTGLGGASAKGGVNGGTAGASSGGASGAGASGPNPTPTPTEKGTSLGAKLTKTLGAAGGTIVSADGRLTITFPAGALATDTEIGIEPITNKAPLGVGTAYRLTPDGSKFPTPITVTFNYTDGDLEGSASDALFVGYQSSDGLWHMLGAPTVDTAQKTVSNPQSHFTDISMLLGWQLTPAEGAVALGNTLLLDLRYCEPDMFPGQDEELSALVYRCDLEDADLSHLVNITGWSVNGTRGGSVRDGFVNGNGNVAHYDAPGVAPPNNPVAVSVEFTHGKSKTIAVSNVRVISGGWNGTLSWTLTGTETTTDATDTNTWMVSGSGMMKVNTSTVSGLSNVESVSSSYHYSYVDDFHNTSNDGVCMRTLTQKLEETLDGTSSDVMTAGFYLFDTGLGDGTVSISAALPDGMTQGHIVVDGTENDSGTGGNCTSGSHHSDTPLSGYMPTDSFMVTGMIDSAGIVQGSALVRLDTQPPRDYQVTWNLSPR